LVVGGVDAGGGDKGSLEIYDPVGDTWTLSADTLTVASSWNELALLNDGTVAVIGGLNAGIAINNIDIYDPVADTITAAGTMSITRVGHSVAILPNGKVLIAGGRNITVMDFGVTNPPAINKLATCEIFDPATGLCTATGSMAYERVGHELVPLPDGRILVIGGYGKNACQTATSDAIKSVEIYDPETGRWERVCELRYGHICPVAKLLPDSNKVLVALGHTTALAPIGLEKSEYIDVSTFKNTLVPNSFTSANAYYNDKNSACVLIDDKVFFYGAFNGWGVTEAAVLIPDENTIGVSGLNGVFEVDTADAAGFTYKTPNDAHYTSTDGSAVLTTFKAAATVGNKGPFIFDPDVAPAMTGIGTVTTVELVKGNGYTLLDVADASIFPDEEGWICLAFGTSNQMAPIYYMGLYSPTQLIIDYSFKYTATLPVGTSVVLLAQKGPYAPEAGVGAFYLTSSPSGRAAAVTGLGMAVAAGVDINTTTVYPGDNGLGNAGLPVTGKKIADKVAIWAEDQDAEVALAREGT
jgi:hypothetical protein